MFRKRSQGLGESVIPTRRRRRRTGPVVKRLVPSTNGDSEVGELVDRAETTHRERRLDAGRPSGSSARFARRNSGKSMKFVPMALTCTPRSGDLGGDVADQHVRGRTRRRVERRARRRPGAGRAREQQDLAVALLEHRRDDAAQEVVRRLDATDEALRRSSIDERRKRPTTIGPVNAAAESMRPNRSSAVATSSSVAPRAGAGPTTTERQRRHFPGFARPATTRSSEGSPSTRSWVEARKEARQRRPDVVGGVAHDGDRTLTHWVRQRRSAAQGLTSRQFHLSPTSRRNTRRVIPTKHPRARTVGTWASNRFHLRRRQSRHSSPSTVATTGRRTARRSLLPWRRGSCPWEPSFERSTSTSLNPDRHGSSTSTSATASAFLAEQRPPTPGETRRWSALMSSLATCHTCTR